MNFTDKIWSKKHMKKSDWLFYVFYKNLHFESVLAKFLNRCSCPFLEGAAVQLRASWLCVWSCVLIFGERKILKWRHVRSLKKFEFTDRFWRERMKCKTTLHLCRRQLWTFVKDNFVSFTMRILLRIFRMTSSPVPRGHVTRGAFLKPKNFKGGSLK